MSNEQLVEQIRNGYHVTQNMQRLYEGNLPLLKKFVRPFTCYEPEADLLQEAYFGLWEAAKQYESSKNVKFMTYAGYWVRQSIIRYIENCGSVIRRPSGFNQKMSQYNKAVQEFVQAYSRFPTDWEMAEALGISLQEVGKIKIALQEVASLEAPVSEDDELTLGDSIADKYNLEDDVIDEITQRTLKCGLWPIVERYTGIQQYQVIRGYYKYGMTLRQIAEQLGISIEQARQFKEAGLRQLRQYKATKNLQEKLEIVTGAVYRTGFVGFRQQGSTVENIAIRRYELDKISEVQKKTRLRKD